MQRGAAAAVAILPSAGYSGEIADVGEEILRAHHVRGGNADGLADYIYVGHEQRPLQFSGKAQRLECARLLAARYAAVSSDCDQPRRKYELACTHARPECCGRRYTGRNQLFARLAPFLSAMRLISIMASVVA